MKDVKNRVDGTIFKLWTKKKAKDHTIINFFFQIIQCYQISKIFIDDYDKIDSRSCSFCSSFFLFEQKNVLQRANWDQFIYVYDKLRQINKPKETIAIFNVCFLNITTL